MTDWYTGAPVEGVETHLVGIGYALTAQFDLGAATTNLDLSVSGPGVETFGSTNTQTGPPYATLPTAGEDMTITARLTGNLPPANRTITITVSDPSVLELQGSGVWENTQSTSVSIQAKRPIGSPTRSCTITIKKCLSK